MGVPLAIVDKEKLLKLINKLFGAQDTGAEFQMDAGTPNPQGSRRITIKIEATVSRTFANALLGNQGFDYVNAAQSTPTPPAPNATPPSTEPPPKKKADK